MLEQLGNATQDADQGLDAQLITLSERGGEMVICLPKVYNIWEALHLTKYY